MADKMWDILRFLKNPEGEAPAADNVSPNAKAEKDEIDSQLMSALEQAEEAVDEALASEASEPEIPFEDTGTALFEQSSESIATAIDIDEQQKVTEETSDISSLPPAAEESETPPQITETAPNAVLPESQEVIEKEPEPEAGDAQQDTSEERLLKIPISRIKPNPFQPRKVMGENEITELSESIKELGVLQPILVKQIESGYELIAGERRLRASQRAGLQEIPAMVVETEPLTQQIIALVENIQRKNLSAIEEALCLHDIISKTGWSQTELSRRTGRSQASIANKLRLLRLDQSVQDLVIAGKLGERQARSLLSLSVEEQKLLAQKAIDEDLSAKALEELSENWNNRPSNSRKSARSRQDSTEGPAGDLLGDIATLINRHRSKGVSAQWKVMQMNQSSLVVEISVDLLEGTSTLEVGADDR